VKIVTGRGEHHVEADIEISPEVAPTLAQHLEEQGRLGVKTTAEVGTLVQHSVRKQWGNGGTTFTDGRGAGWLMDIGDDFDGEALYAIVRRRNGKPIVEEVIEEEDLLRRRRAAEGDTSASVAPPAQSQITPPAMPRGEGRRLAPPFVPQTTPKPEDPVLIRYVKPGGKGTPQRVSKETKYASYESELQELFANGIKPDDVEVWTNVKRPKVKIELG